MKDEALLMASSSWFHEVSPKPSMVVPGAGPQPLGFGDAPPDWESHGIDDWEEQESVWMMTEGISKILLGESRCLDGIMRS